jgi:hypothetical protein
MSPELNTRGNAQGALSEFTTFRRVLVLPTNLVELAAKAWNDAGLIGESDLIAAFEPRLRLHLENCDLAVGIAVPFALHTRIRVRT